MAPVYKIAVIQLHPKVRKSGLSLFVINFTSYPYSGTSWPVPVAAFPPAQVFGRAFLHDGNRPALSLGRTASKRDFGIPRKSQLKHFPVQSTSRSFSAYQPLHLAQPMQIEANHAKACDFIRAAASQGAHLAVLPEYHLTNWAPSDPRFRSLCAQSPKYLASYRALAKKLHINIVPGTMVEQRADQSLVNVAYFVDHDGAILSSYRKKNLWHPERPHLAGPDHHAPHEPHAAFDSPLGRLGLLICWDLAFPEAFRQLVAAGAKIIVIPTFWCLSDCDPAGLAHNPRAEALFLESALVARSFENTCAVVFANAGGAPAGPPGSYAGLSQVAVPFKGALGKLGCAEGMSVVDLDMQILEDAEANYRVREDMGREEWHYAHTLTRRDERSKL